MKILALETSAKAVSCALYEDGKRLAFSFQNSGLTHSCTLMPMVDDMLRNCECDKHSIDVIACAAGPGSFTGLRIGIAATKGLAWGLEKPCAGVSTLEAMAAQMGGTMDTVVAVMDARRNQVYNALFRAEGGALTRLTEDRAIALEELGKDLENEKNPVFLVGDGSNLCYNTLKEALPNLVLPPEHRMHQRAAGVGLVAAEMIARGEPGDAATLEPNYLRLSQAERERLAREQK